jgi:ArsR family transcriptional regulator, lead/cadmium/zinc/bismuth-responsive transcriptional repressor
MIKYSYKSLRPDSDPLEKHHAMDRLRVVDPDRVKNARGEASPDHELAALSMIYRVLGDPSRLKILMALRRDEMCVCDLAALTGISESAVSHQLRRLKDLSLVRSRRDGQVVYYALDDKHVVLLLDIGLRHVREK